MIIRFLLCWNIIGGLVVGSSWLTAYLGSAQIINISKCSFKCWSATKYLCRFVWLIAGKSSFGENDSGELESPS